MIGTLLLRDCREISCASVVQYYSAIYTMYAALNDTPGLVGSPFTPLPTDIRKCWHDWMDKEGYPFWPFWENIRSWWKIRELPNLLLLHFNDLKRDMPGEMRRIARFLDIPINEDRWPYIVEYCSFDWMKNNATRSVPLSGAFWDEGAKVFINKGENGRWMDTLTSEESAQYEARAIKELGFECAQWLAGKS